MLKDCAKDAFEEQDQSPRYEPNPEIQERLDGYEVHSHKRIED
jgi:hypothetical protein